MKRVRSKLTYANVISTLCLVLLVGGGTAYAATELGKEAVGTKNLAKAAVTPAKLSKSAKKSLTGRVGATGAVGPQGPQGPQGAAGKEGSLGKEGPQGPGALTVEELATSSLQTLGTFSGVKVVDLCSGGNVLIEFEETSGGFNPMNLFGTVVQGGTVFARQGDLISQSVVGSEVSTDLTARDNGVTKAFSRFDLHLSASNCELTGVITPSTVR